MRVVYTDHAEKQIEERKLLKIWVEEAVCYPDYIRREADLYVAIKKLNGITLEVVHSREKYIKIVTCYVVK
ncbi:MAG: DUF4258 domain-containing protein [Nanoarchaeota archaeon]